MAPGSSQAAPATGPQKHRACDECRFRKIACSKEADGCLRCLKEGIVCVYSPQKPMGRPRKRRHAQPVLSVSLPMPAPAPAPAPVPMSAAVLPASQSQPTSLLVSTSPPSLVQALTVAVAALPSPPLPPPPSTSALSTNGNHAGASSAYIGAGHHHNYHHHHHHHHHHNDAAHQENHSHEPILSADLVSDLLSQPLTLDLSSYLDLIPDYGTGDYDLPQMEDNGSLTHMPRYSQGFFDGTTMPAMNMNQANLFDGISFDETDPSMSTVSKDLNDSLQRYMVSQYLQPPAPSESSPSTLSSCFDLSQSAGTPKPNPPVSCDCLTSLCVALGSLNRLPPDVISAMRVARNATKIAHDTLTCDHCYGDMYDLSKPAPISRFQSIMFLGALVPSACNAYASILEMVDRDTERAKVEYRSLYFSFKSVGGMWASIIDETDTSSSPDCLLLKSYNDRFLEPDIWRTTIRAILKVEVYGFNHRTASVPSSVDCGTSPHVYLHRGLKDLVTLIDEKNERRHDIADALIQANHPLPNQNYLLSSGTPKPCPREDRHCVRMLDVARMALSNLVIT